MNPAHSSSSLPGLSLRCKDGDMTVIVCDLPGCEGNIGRIVQVRGPTKKLSGYVCWQIKPLDNKEVLIREFTGKVVSELVDWKSNILHTDCFLMPICPSKDDKSLDANIEVRNPTPELASA